MIIKPRGSIHKPKGKERAQAEERRYQHPDIPIRRLPQPAQESG
jgi:hypothetical protein